MTTTSADATWHRTDMFHAKGVMHVINTEDVLLVTIHVTKKQEPVDVIAAAIATAVVHVMEDATRKNRADATVAAIHIALNVLNVIPRDIEQKYTVLATFHAMVTHVNYSTAKQYVPTATTAMYGATPVVRNQTKAAAVSATANVTQKGSTTAIGHAKRLATNTHVYVTRVTQAGQNLYAQYATEHVMHNRRTADVHLVMVK